MKKNMKHINGNNMFNIKPNRDDFKNVEVGDNFSFGIMKDIIWTKVSNDNATIDWKSTVKNFKLKQIDLIPLNQFVNNKAVENIEMYKYFLQLSIKGQSDKFINGLCIFNIGDGDVEKFPLLKDFEQVWILSSGNIQMIHKNSIQKGRK